MTAARRRHRLAVAAVAACGLLAGAALVAGCFDDGRLDPYRCESTADCASAPGCTGAGGGCTCEDGLCLPPKVPGTDAAGPGTDAMGPGTDAGSGTDAAPGTDAAGLSCTTFAECTDPALPVCAMMTCQSCSADEAQCASIDPTRPFCRMTGECGECRNNGDCGGAGAQCVDGTCM